MDQARRKAIVMAAACAALAMAPACLAQEANRPANPPADRATDSDSPAQPAFSLAAEYVADLVAVPQGPRHGTRAVGIATLTGDLDLDSAAGWSGAQAHFQVIASMGLRPNDLAGTLQGVNNIEVPENRVRLFEAYLEQKLGALPASLRLGFSDLNAEFYSNDAAGLLIAPAFGIGSELAATGPNGPSVFPSTALTARLRIEARGGAYGLFAAVNAESGVLGDPGGVRRPLREGALLIAEGGIATAGGKLAAGYWSYSRRQPVIGQEDAPETRRKPARGAYVLGELPLAHDAAGETRVAAFARAGISDGDTTPYRGGWQAGLLFNALLPGRPEGQLSIGANQAFLSRAFRRARLAEVDPHSGRETGLEITYADKLAAWLTVQPDAQYIRTAPRHARNRDSVVLGIRLTLTPPPGQPWL